jgi:hypothetical protein
VHALQLLPEQGFRESESYTTMSLDPGASDEMLVQVVVSVVIVTDVVAMTLCCCRRCLE